MVSRSSTVIKPSRSVESSRTRSGADSVSIMSRVGVGMSVARPVKIAKTAKKTTNKTKVEKTNRTKTKIKKSATKTSTKKITTPTEVSTKKINAPTTKSVTRKTAVKKSAKNTKITTKKSAIKTPSSKATSTKTKKPKVTDRTRGTNGRQPLGHLLVGKLMRDAGFKGEVSASNHLLDKYSTDESVFSVRPQVVLKPHNRRDVEIATKVVAAEVEHFPSLSLTPRAAGTGLSGGSLTDSIVIDMCAHLHKIGAVQEKKGVYTIDCEPGVMLRDLERVLKRKGLYIPAYPASKDICSVGGCVGNNAAGADTLRYGHFGSWVSSMEVVLNDGHVYNIKPLTYREFKLLIKQNHEHARIARDIFALIKKNEKTIKQGRPHTKKNSAGYALWDVLPEGVRKFQKGEGVFDLTRLLAGSQGTIGIVVGLTLQAIPIPTNTTTLAVPIFDLDGAAEAIVKLLEYNPINVEIFDSLSFELALQNPDFFKKRLPKREYYRTMLKMYSTYHVRFRRKVPEFTILATLDQKTTQDHSINSIISHVSSDKATPRVLNNPVEREMYWQIRRASYTLSKFQDQTKRPAAFLEDMAVPPHNLAKFFVSIKKLLKEFGTSAAVHGHGGDGHFHFYPLVDFTDPKTPALIEDMSEKFFKMAIKYDGNLCGEHNDGIIRTPYLSKMFSKSVLELFKTTENLFDPHDIFNPGKKVNPRFDIKETMRRTN